MSKTRPPYPAAFRHALDAAMSLTPLRPAPSPRACHRFEVAGRGREAVRRAAAGQVAGAPAGGVELGGALLGLTCGVAAPRSGLK